MFRVGWQILLGWWAAAWGSLFSVSLFSVPYNNDVSPGQLFVISYRIGRLYLPIAEGNFVKWKWI